MTVLGPPLYEWMSHNLFVIALAIGSVAAMVYFIINVGKKKGRYRS